ncbi:hypothetical protein GCM10023168_15170 [Fodinibacter luteus]|uniref:Tetratricopeptide repeat protein n=1 Tax=Fodinibacter luteus TaxID=552064 RepID=A0ABP8KB36_9MICO
MTDAGGLPLPMWAGGSPDREDASALAVDADDRLGRGDVDGAVASLREAWTLVEDDPGSAGTAAACLRVLLHLGNVDRAVDLLLPRLGWAGEVAEPWERMWFCATAAHVLEQAGSSGLAPATVGGRAAAEVAADLARTAGALASSFDAHDGSAGAARALAAAHDPALVGSEPTLPPTRLPSTPPPRPDPADAVPATTPVVDRAAALREAIASSQGDLEAHTGAWLRDRDALLPVASTDEWVAVSLLDRVSAQAAGDPRRHRELLTSALEAARAAGDLAGEVRSAGELAVLDVVVATRPEAATEARARARACAERLESNGKDAEAAGLWRRLAWFGGAGDAAGDIGRAAAAYGRAGLDEPRLLCLVEGAAAVAPTDPVTASGILDDLEPHTDGRPELAATVLDVRARLARAAGDLDAAQTHLRRALRIRGVPDRVRLAALLALSDVLVEQGAWDELEGPAADLVAAATRDHDPVLLAYGQRFLGLAYVETGRPAEAAELLEAALPVLREHGPGLVGPVAWALGNALATLGRWERATGAFSAAAEAFDADGRLLEAAHAHWRAAATAWESDDAVAAAGHFDVAATRAHDCGAVALHVDALRSRAALRAEGGDVDGGLRALDDAVASGERLAARLGSVPDEAFDPEVLEPDVLRQGAHLLADGGRVDEAVARLGRARALVGGDLEIVLRAEAAMVLADADRLDEVEPDLRAVVAELHAAGLADPRAEAAGVLARALDRAGRTVEAEEAWARWGPDA